MNPGYPPTPTAGVRSAAFIPIKGRSTRVPGKNLRDFRGRPLYQWIITHALEAACFTDVYVDTDVAAVKVFALQHRLMVIDRDPRLASDAANGNDLLCHHRRVCPDYDLYFQLFATAPLLSPQSIRRAHDRLVHRGPYDSVFTARPAPGWFWLPQLPTPDSQPPTPDPLPCTPLYRPGILPRSQDHPPLIQETTGLYGVTAAALDRYHSRVGARPFAIYVPAAEAADLDQESDFHEHAHTAHPQTRQER